MSFADKRGVKREFDIKKPKPQVEGLAQSDIDLAFQFSKRMYKEFGDLLKAIVLFGSHAKQLSAKSQLDREQQQKKPGDIDVLVLVDDVSVELTQELAETYRIIVKKLIIDISPRLHITSLKLSTFWAYIRVGDPVGLNIIREGIALLDTGFFDPLKALLRRGMIRPSPESVFTYFARAPKTLQNARWHVMQAAIDLYWAIIDASHAALMTQDIVPPSPEHVAEMLQEKLVKPGFIDRRVVKTVERFYKLYKQITRREIKQLSGREFDELCQEAERLVNAMKEFINKRKGV